MSLNPSRDRGDQGTSAEVVAYNTQRVSNDPYYQGRDRDSSSLPAASQGGSLYGLMNDKAPTYGFGVIDHRCVPQMSYFLARWQWFLACS